MKALDLNDQLDGKTISSLRLGCSGLDGGLLAYGATFIDGSEGLYTLCVRIGTHTWNGICALTS
jgi:hypothetical protein